MPSSYADALFRTGENLRRGLSDLGAGRRDDAQLALLQQKATFDIGRQKAQDARQALLDSRANEQWQLQKPGMELASQKAKMQQEEFNAPLTLDDMADPGLHLDFFESGLDEKFGQILGAQAVKSGGKIAFVRPDGTPLPKGVLQDPMTQKRLGAAAIGYLRPETLDNYAEIIQSKMQADPASAEEGKRELAWIENIKKDPVKLLDMQISQLQFLGDDAGLARKVAERNALVKGQADLAKEQRGYKQEEKLEGMRQTGANQREQARSGKAKAGFEGGEWRSPNGEVLSTDDAFARYAKTAPAMIDEATGEARPSVAFEDWATREGYSFIPSGTSAETAQGKTAPGSTGRGMVRGSVNARTPMSDTPPVQGARRGNDGGWYVPDPNRPGKYMKVQ